jgi:hypothetical protein
MPQHIELFLSAVSDEFRTYRDSLCARLKRPNVDIHVQEDFIATGTDTLDKLDGYIARCAAVIHLAGDMTGSWARPATLQALCTRHADLAGRLAPLKPSLESGDPPLSYTQWEAYLAVYYGKPLVIAVPAPGTPRDATYRVEAEQQAAQKAHLERLRALSHYAEITFANADQLAMQILRSSILDLLVEAGVASALDDFKTLREVATSLSEKSDQLRSAERQRRMDMAELFAHISGCLTAVAGEIRAGNVPHGRCAELFMYAQALPDKIRNELGDDEAERLGSKLLSAYNVEGVAGRLLQNVQADTKPYLKEIDEASGEFQALANLVKLG